MHGEFGAVVHAAFAAAQGAVVHAVGAVDVVAALARAVGRAFTRAGRLAGGVAREAFAADGGAEGAVARVVVGDQGLHQAVAAGRFVLRVQARGELRGWRRGRLHGGRLHGYGFAVRPHGHDVAASQQGGGGQGEG